LVHENAFLAGSYKYTPRGSTSFPNLFIAGDWIVNRHGSFSKVRHNISQNVIEKQ
jgi:uncharacterized protein with NAD-binding domain and iron-sulfur cluster